MVGETSSQYKIIENLPQGDLEENSPHLYKSIQTLQTHPWLPGVPSRESG